MTESLITCAAPSCSMSNAASPMREDVRFTARGDTRYAFVMAWLESGKVTIKSLAEGSQHYPRKVGRVRLLGAGRLRFTQDANGLVVTLPGEKPNECAYGLQISPARLSWRISFK